VFIKKTDCQLLGWGMLDWDGRCWNPGQDLGDPH